MTPIFQKSEIIFVYSDTMQPLVSQFPIFGPKTGKWCVTKNSSENGGKWLHEKIKSYIVVGHFDTLVPTTGSFTRYWFPNDVAVEWLQFLWRSTIPTLISGCILTTNDSPLTRLAPHLRNTTDAIFVFGRRLRNVCEVMEIFSLKKCLAASDDLLLLLETLAMDGYLDGVVLPNNL